MLLFGATRRSTLTPAYNAVSNIQASITDNGSFKVTDSGTISYYLSFVVSPQYGQGTLTSLTVIPESDFSYSPNSVWTITATSQSTATNSPVFRSIGACLAGLVNSSKLTITFPSTLNPDPHTIRVVYTTAS